MSSLDQKNSKQQFNNIFQRLVSFSSATKQKKPHDLCHNILKNLGMNEMKLFTGVFTNNSSTSETPKFEEIRKMPNNAMKTLYMNFDQLGLLTKRLVVFMSDFGTGK